MRPLSSLIVLSVSCALAAGCGLADIRPDPIAKLKTIDDARATKGRALIQQMQQAHGGLDAWQAKGNAQVQWEDQWPSFLTRVFGMPWDEHPASMRQTMMLGQDHSRLEFLNGDDKGTAWGIQHWSTYTVGRKTLPEFDQDDDITFWLPTMQYFFEAPFRLHEGQYVAYGGSAKRGGQTYELVYVTWGGVEPQERVDQYVAWIDQKTQRLAYLEFTVRDLFGFVTSAAMYEDYKAVDGLLVPGKITIVGDLDDPTDVVHRLVVQDAKLGVDLPKGFLIPDPKRRSKK